MQINYKKLIPLVKKYFPNATEKESIEILDKYTNLKDTDLEIEQQIQLHHKKQMKGEK